MPGRSVGFVAFDVIGNYDQFRASLASNVEQAVGAVVAKVTVTADTDAAVASVNEVAAAAAKDTANVVVTAETDGARAAITDLASAATATAASVDVVANTDAARSAIGDLQTAVSVPVDGVADFGAVRAAIDEISRPVTVPVDFETSGASPQSLASKGGGSGAGGLFASAAVVGGGAATGAVVAYEAYTKVKGAITDVFKLTGELDVASAELGARLNLSAADTEHFAKVFQQLGADADLGKASMLDAGEAAVTLAGKGITQKEAVESLLKPTLQLSILAKETAKDAATQVGDITNILKVPTADVAKILEQLASANRQGADIRGVASSLAAAGGTYSQLFKDQTPVEQAKNLIVYSTQLQRAGLSADNAGTAMNRALLSLVNPSKPAANAIDNLTKVAKEAGLTFEKNSDIFRTAQGTVRPLNEVFDSLRNVQESGKLTAVQYGGAVDDVFGSFGSQAVNRLTVASSGFADMTKHIEEQGNVAALSKAQTAGYQGALDSIGGVTETLKVQIGDLIRPAAEGGLRGLATVLGEVSTKVGGLDFSNMGGQLQTVVAGITTALPSLDGLSHVFDGVQELWASALEAAKAIWDTFGGTIMAVVNGAIETIKAIIRDGMQIITGIFQLITDILHGKWGEAWEDVKQILSAAWDFIQTYVRVQIVALGTFLLELAPVIGRAFSAAWDKAKELTSAGIGAVIDFMSKLPGRTADAIIEFGPKLAGVIVDAGVAILAAAGALVVALVKEIGTLITKIPGALLTLGSTIGGLVADAAIEAVKEAGKLAGKIARALGDLLVSGIRGLAREVLDAAKSIIPDVGQLVRSAVANLPGGGSSSVIDLARKKAEEQGKPGFDADGRLVTSPRLSWTGEAGAEVILPLTRPNRMRALLAMPEVRPIVERYLPRDTPGAVHHWNLELPQLVEPGQWLDALEDRARKRTGGAVLAPAMSHGR